MILDKPIVAVKKKDGEKYKVVGIVIDSETGKDRILFQKLTKDRDIHYTGDYHKFMIEFECSELDNVLKKYL